MISKTMPLPASDEVRLEHVEADFLRAEGVLAAALPERLLPDAEILTPDINAHTGRDKGARPRTRMPTIGNGCCK